MGITWETHHSDRHKNYGQEHRFLNLRKTSGILLPHAWEFLFLEANVTDQKAAWKTVIHGNHLKHIIMTVKRANVY